MKAPGQAVSTVEEILDVAERMIRTGGYHAMSFRDIAEQVKIKSASVHYHFATKEDLGMAVTRRYKDKTLAFLGEPADETRPAAELVRRYLELFRQSLDSEARVCLCGILTFEAGGLPTRVRDAALEIAGAHAEWLTRVLLRLRPGSDPARARRKAWLAINATQGALAAAAASGRRMVFEDTAQALEESLVGERA